MITDEVADSSTIWRVCMTRELWGYGSRRTTRPSPDAPDYAKGQGQP
ncbi:hypothetical protein AM1_4103 [Acaryochloris marina MBIC11017]|uniref:Uncharacterized protein n=1 Tax=Acaryochloris marina (strain MBIC 11017) TaxID=329726 RepID=B0CAL8_ACAM1|nr:hypothetical protein AM1_4103 [Acaryochloris marina MBIC11017]